MRKRTLIAVCLSTLAVICWTMLTAAFFFGFKIFERAIESSTGIIYVENASLESTPGVRLLDANNPLFQVLRMEPNRVDVAWKGNNTIYLKESICRVKKLDSQLVHVMGEFNNKQYPVTIDSGLSGDLMVNDVVIIENELEIFPFEPADPVIAGFCSIDKIAIGDMTITKPPCYYIPGHYEKRVLGRTRWKQSDIIFGLKLMRQFNYILIDNIASEVEFGMRKSFAPDPNEAWLQNPMSVETDEKNNQRAVVEIPIAGKLRRAVFDTGASNILLMADSIWEKFSSELEVVKVSQGRLRMMYGWQEAQMNTVRKLEIGGRVLSNAVIAVQSDESREGPDFFLLGMGCFKDTIIVLDFENNLLRVKRPQQSEDIAQNDE